MSNPRLLDLFCGAGGAGRGYQMAGFHVTGVDINPQPRYAGDVFVQGDALEYVAAHGHEFDAIHASPPCQAHTRKPSRWGRARKNVITHLNLIPETRDALLATGRPWVIENVIGAPIRAQLLLCGTMFGLPIIKHRLFESNLRLSLSPATCDHRDVYNPWMGAGRSAARLREAQGTPWIPMSGGASRANGHTGDLFNAIPPAYTEFIGRQLLAAVQMEAAS